MFKINPKDRPSVRTILTSHRVSRFLRAHLPPQVKPCSHLRTRNICRTSAVCCGVLMISHERKPGAPSLLLIQKKLLFSLNKLYSALNPRQPTEPEERGRRAGRWNPEEATKVAKFLGEKSLMKDSFEGRAALRLVSGFMRGHSAVSLCYLDMRSWLLLKILIEY